MTTPGGVVSLPKGALTLSTLSSDLEDMSGDAMKTRAVDRMPSIFNSSTGLDPALDITPFGILTRIWAEVNSLIANADPADIQGPEDLPPLVLEFIEGLPLVGQFVGILEAILGEYEGEDELLLQLQQLFGPIRSLMQGDVEGFITGVLDPTGLMPSMSSLTGWLSGGLIPIPFGSISGDTPNMLPEPMFGLGSIADNPQWTVDPANSRTADSTGAATVLADGTIKALRSGTSPSDVITVAYQQKISKKIYVKHTGYAGSGSPIQLQVVPFTGTVQGSPVLLASYAPAGANLAWPGQALAGTYTVPAGVTGIQMRLVVTAGATAGQIWFDEAEARQAGLMQQSWMSGAFGPTLFDDLNIFDSDISSLFGISQDIVDMTVQSILGIFEFGFSLFDMGEALKHIPFLNILGVQGTPDIGNSVQSGWNQLGEAYGGAPTPHNEMQQIVVSDQGGGTVTGGTTVLSFDGESTTSVAYNANATTVQNALTALPNIGVGNLVATGGPLNTTPVTVEFIGALANAPLPLIGRVDSLVGGTQPRTSVAQVQMGGPAIALSELTTLAQEQAQNSANAIGLAGLLADIVNIRNNRSISGAIHRMSEGSNAIGQGGRTTFVASSTLAPIAFQRIEQTVDKSFVQVVALKTGTIDAFYINVYKHDEAGGFNSVFKSADLKSQLAATNAWITATFPANINTMPGDDFAVEAVVVGSGTVTLIAQLSSDVPIHPTEFPKHVAASRNPATLGVQPNSITAGQMEALYGGNQIFTSLGTGTPPPAYQPPETTPFDYTGAVQPYTIPTWARVAGAKLDVIVLGGGGGGQANYGTALPQWDGGNAGEWASQTLICGVDYAVGATSVSVYPAKRGDSAGAYWTNGKNGQASYIEWTHPTLGAQRVTGNGGNGGGNGGTSAPYGKSPGNHTHQGITYPGGSAVGLNATGSYPGGGGGGAGSFQVGGNGAHGKCWIRARPF